MRALTSLDHEVRANLRGSNLKQVDGAALLDQGRGLIHLKLFSQAIPALEQACAALPASAEAHQLYGLALLGDSDVAQLAPYAVRRAELAFAHAVEIDPTLAATLDPYRMVVHGLLCFNDGAVAQADELFAQAAVKYPGCFPAWRMRAATLLRLGRDNEVLDACRKGLKLDPRNEPVLLLALAACARQHQPERAIELADRIAALRGEGARAADVLRDIGLVIAN
jgi:tetratricopeptide (TPR) repeat protein